MKEMKRKPLNYFWGRKMSSSENKLTGCTRPLNVSCHLHYWFFPNLVQNKILQKDNCEVMLQLLVPRGVLSTSTCVFPPQEHLTCSSQASAVSSHHLLSHQRMPRYALVQGKRICRIISGSSKWNQSLRWANCLKATRKVSFCFHLLPY